MRITASSDNLFLLPAAAWLWLEAILRWFAPVFALALLLGNLALWGVLTQLPGILQFALSILFWITMVIFLVREFHYVSWPNAHRVKSRLEQAGALHHQPLQTLGDAPIRRNPLSDALWQHHQVRAAGLLSQLRWPKLRADYAVRDPLALRWLLILLALLGALHAPALALPRLLAAFAPTNIRALASLGPGEVYLYFTPPAYTGLAPIYLSSANAMPKKLVLPVGTKLWLRVAGGVVKPIFDSGDDEKKLSRAEDNFFVLQTTLTAGKKLQLRQGFLTLLNLPVELQPNVPPDLTLENVTLMPRGELQVNICAQDHYALRALTLYWQSTAQPEIQAARDIPVSGTKFCRAVVIDVASEPLAGQTVAFWASAENSTGLRRDSAKQNFVLPHAEFQNPWAARLAAARQDYALHGARDALNQTLNELLHTKLPVGLFLSVQSAQQQLWAADKTADNTLLANLWQITQRLEEGEYADIAANWRATRNELLAALADWRMPENAAEKLLAQTEDNWNDYAPALGNDPDSFAKTWQDIARWIASGQRERAATMLRELDENPTALLDKNQTATTVQQTDSMTDATAATALQQIRARLQDPNISLDERNYLERLIHHQPFQ